MVKKKERKPPKKGQMPFPMWKAIKKKEKEREANKRKWVRESGSLMVGLTLKGKQNKRWDTQRDRGLQEVKLGKIVDGQLMLKSWEIERVRKGLPVGPAADYQRAQQRKQQIAKEAQKAQKEREAEERRQKWAENAAPPNPKSKTNNHPNKKSKSKKKSKKGKKKR